MTVGVGHHVREKSARHFRQPDKDRWIVAVVVCEEEGSRIELHQNVTIAEFGELDYQHRIVVAEASEEATVEEE